MKQAQSGDGCLTDKRLMGKVLTEAKDGSLEAPRKLMLDLLLRGRRPSRDLLCAIFRECIKSNCKE